jgi:hypothetical protein
MDVVDQVARDIAMRAIAMIESHEKTCEARANESITWRKLFSEKIDGCFVGIHSELQSISETIKSLYGRMWLAMVGFIGVLVTIIGFLIEHHGL